MAELALRMNVDYGAPELKQNYQKFMLRGLAAASLLNLLGVGTYWGSIYLAAEEEPKLMVRIVKYSELGPPPSLTSSNAPPPVTVAAPSVKPSVGIPVPVPDAEINPEQTIATQKEMSEALGEIGEGKEGELRIEDEPPPDFVAFEKGPVPIKKVIPAYPEIARRAGVEGTVWVKVWVDKEGRVRKGEVLKSDAAIFDQPAIDAAVQWVFTPALMKSGPVSVWVSIPLKFRLQGN